LQQLLGVGLSVADNIIKYRATSGNFDGPQDLPKMKNLKLLEEVAKINFEPNNEFDFSMLFKNLQQNLGEESISGNSADLSETGDQDSAKQEVGIAVSLSINPPTSTSSIPNDDIVSEAYKKTISDKNYKKETEVGTMSKDYSLPLPLRDASSTVKQLADTFGFSAEGGTIPPAPSSPSHGIAQVPLSHYQYPPNSIGPNGGMYPPWGQWGQIPQQFFPQ
jgi:hypothetical protein